MSLLVAIPAMLAHWAYYHFPWASTAQLLYFYLLLCLWTYWLSFLLCRPIGLFISFFGFLWLIYFTFTSCYARGLAGYYTCHIGPLGFLPLLLGFHGPFTLLLPLVVPVGLLAIIPIIVAHWAFYLFSWVFIVHLLSSCFFHFLFHLSSLLSFSAVGPFVKNGYQHFPNPIIWIA